MRRFQHLVNGSLQALCGHIKTSFHILRLRFPNRFAGFSVAQFKGGRYDRGGIEPGGGGSAIHHGHIKNRIDGQECADRLRRDIGPAIGNLVVDLRERTINKPQRESWDSL